MFESVVLPFCILITLGAAVLGPLEGWSVVESLYFAVVSPGQRKLTDAVLLFLLAALIERAEP